MNINDLTKLDDEKIIAALAIKKTIIQFLNREEIVNFFCKVIEDSDSLKFARKNYNTYISRSQPILDLEFNLKAAMKKYPDLVLTGSDRDLVERNRGNIVNLEFNTQYMDLMISIYSSIIGKPIINPDFKYAEFIKLVCPHGEEIRDQLYDIEKSSDNLEEYGFIFRFACGVLFPSRDDNIDDDFNITVEMLL